MSIKNLSMCDFQKNGDPKTSQPVFCLYYSSGCGHCITALPKFLQASQIHQNKKVMMCTLQADNPANRECSKRFKDMLYGRSQIVINGYPSYYYFKNGKWYEYEGSRETRDLLAFVDKL